MAACRLRVMFSVQQKKNKISASRKMINKRNASAGLAEAMAVYSFAAISHILLFCGVKST